MKKITKERLESQLWEAFDVLRGNYSRIEVVKHFLALIFLKQINHIFEMEKSRKVEEQVSKGVIEKVAEVLIDNNAKYYEYFYVPDRARWDHIISYKHDIKDQLDMAFRSIENEPKNTYVKDVFKHITFSENEILSKSRVYKTMLLIDKINFSNFVDSSILGDAVEEVISKIAADGVKEYGEFYTPKSISKLLVSLLNIHEVKSIYDPTCGTGSLLLHAKHENSNIRLYGQEMNHSVWSLSKMNMILHQCFDNNITLGDTIRKPKHIKDESLIQFDAIVCNLPFTLSDWGNEIFKTDQYNRFVFGEPPKTYGHLAFIQHMIASINDKGRLAVIVPNGVLYRSGEGSIRRRILKKDLLEGIISLPANLFYGTSVPASILVFNKNKSIERKNKVIFIDASLGFIKVGFKNHLRDEDIEKIVATFQTFNRVEQYAEVIDLHTIKDQGFILSINRYVDTLDREETINVLEVVNEINELNSEINQIELELNEYLKNIN